MMLTISCRQKVAQENYSSQVENAWGSQVYHPPSTCLAFHPSKLTLSFDTPSRCCSLLSPISAFLTSVLITGLDSNIHPASGE